MGSLLGSKDAAFFDGRVREMNRLAGTSAITYYAFDFQATPKDPVWNESIIEQHVSDKKRKTVGVNFTGFFEYPEISLRTGEEGQKADYDGLLWLSRKDFEEAFPVPEDERHEGQVKWREPIIGDIVQVQDRYYDVISYDLQDQYNDTLSMHATWLIKVRHRTEYDARRRIEGEE